MHVSKTQASHLYNIQYEILAYLRPSVNVTLAFEITTGLSKDKQEMEDHMTTQFLIPHRHLNKYEAAEQRYTVPLLSSHSQPTTHPQQQHYQVHGW